MKSRDVTTKLNSGIVADRIADQILAPDQKLDNTKIILTLYPVILPLEPWNPKNLTQCNRITKCNVTVIP